MGRPVLLDAFCGAGGCARGYTDAGFDVVGVDINPQPRYLKSGAIEFYQGDAIEFVARHGREFDAIHASPPCQAHSSMRTMPDAKHHPDLIPATRAALQRTGRPYAIENVVGAPLIAPAVLCGTAFGLGWQDAELRRHRLFESNTMLLVPRCQHGRRPRTIGIYGKGVRDSLHKYDRGIDEFTVEHGREAMQIDWMTLAELCQAIPPIYCHHIGLQLLSALTGATESAA